MSATDAIEYRTGTVEADGVTIPYTEAGEGPPVLVLHGLGGTTRFRGIDLLTDRFRVVAPVVPGLHQGAHDEAMSMRDLARTVRSFAEALELERFSVLAFSVAAKVGLWLAIDATDHVEALALSSPAAILPADARVPLVSAESLRHQSDGASPPGLGLASFSANESRFIKRIFGPNRDPQLEDAMSDLTVPTLVLMGKDDYLLAPETGRVYRELSRQVHYVLVPYAGPLIAEQRPTAFASAVGDFLTYRSDFIYSHETGIVND